MNKLGLIDLYHRGAIGNAKYRLIKGGFLKRNEKGFLSLTKKGGEKLLVIERNDYELIIPRTWDQKWRVLIFDIPEHRRSLRDKIRNTLRSIGFKRVQDSVWAYPP